MTQIKVAIIGSGNIGIDLMMKLIKTSDILELEIIVGRNLDSKGLLRANQLGITTTHKGVDGLIEMEEFKYIDIIFDATSANAHLYNYSKIKEFPEKRMIDLTPAAIGPYIVPPVNINTAIESDNVNMVTCAGQATIPMIAAISKVTKVHYGEIVASLASKSVGPGTRANINEFTITTTKAIEQIGGATKGKTIAALISTEPPIIMQDKVITLSDHADKEAIIKSIYDMEAEVQKYVPGYKIKKDIQFEYIPENESVFIEGLGYKFGLKTTIFLEVVGAGHYLPKYAGNLDIITSAALATAEKLAQLNYQLV